MKLKKIASLALAGVMVVSMLAGCSGKSTDDNNGGDPIVNTGVAGKVIDALDEDTSKKVEFTVSSSLEDAAEKYAEYLGARAFNNNAIEKNISQFEKFADLDEVLYDGDFDDNENAQTSLYGGVLTNYGLDEVYAVEEIADKVDSSVSDMNNATIWNDGDKYYTYTFTGNIAVIELENYMGQSTYGYVYTVTRTPSEVKD